MNAEGLSEFLAVARAGTFTGAARRLGVSVAHVSRQVARLEARVGAKLFQRTTRSVRLSGIGEAFFARVEEVEDLLDAAYQGLRAGGDRVGGRVRLSAPTGSTAQSVVVPAVMDLAERHPELEIRVEFNARHVDLVREGFDLAVRTGELADSALIARPLAERTFVAAAAPDYLARHGTPEHPHALERHRCILALKDTWTFVENGRRLPVPVQGRLWLNDGDAVLEACLRGHGIAYIASSGYRDALTKGQLVPVLRPFWRTETSLYAVRLARGFVPARLEVVTDAIQRHARAFSRAEADMIAAL